MPNCPKCNTPLRVNARFCTHCGYECTNIPTSASNSALHRSQPSNGWQAPGSIPVERRKTPPYAPHATYSGSYNVNDAATDHFGLGKREKQIIAAVVTGAIILILLLLLLLLLFTRTQHVQTASSDTTSSVPASAEIVPVPSNNGSGAIVPPDTSIVTENPEGNTIPTPEPSTMPTIAPAITPTPADTPSIDPELINPEDYPEMVVTVQPTSTLGLRSAPDLDAEQFAQLANGEHVRVIDQTNETFWYVYAPSVDDFGYVTASYLTAILVEEVEIREIRSDCTIHVPKILMDSEDISQLNDRISNEICQLTTTEEADCTGIHYSSFSTDQILSLVIEKDFYNGNPIFYVINVSINEQRELKNDEVAILCGVSQYKELAADVIAAYMRNNANNYPEDELYSYISQSTADENLTESSLFINGEQHLCIATSYYFPAGSLKHNVIFDLETSEIYFNI